MSHDRIAAFALEIGAAGIADEARARATTSPGALWRRLEYHLLEHQRALVRSPDELVAWTNGLMLARILAERVVDKRRRTHDVLGEELERWLARERQKFLMGTKVDAIAELRERFATATLRELRRAGPITALDIADELVRDFHAKIVRRVRVSTTAVASQLIGGLHDLFHTLPNVIPGEAFAGLELAPLPAHPLLRVPRDRSGAFGQLADRLTGRRRIAARVEMLLVDELERASAVWIREAAFDFTDAASAIERRFCALLDAAVETGRSAALFADRARRRGLPGLAEARDRLARWSALLAELRGGNS